MKKNKKLQLTAAVFAAIMAWSALPCVSLSASAGKIPEAMMADSREEAYAEGEAIVMYRGTSAIQTGALSARRNTSVQIAQSYAFDTAGDSSIQSYAAGENSDGFVVSLVTSDKLSTEELIAQLEKQSDVVCAEPNFRIRLASNSDPLAAYQWALENTGQNGGNANMDIHPQAPELTPDLSAGEQVVAVIDTGVDYTHPDLKNRMWENPDADTGLLNGLHGYDFVNCDDDPMDDNGHGTHCAGIIAAEAENDVGTVGVAAADSVKIMALKILDEEGNGYGMEFVAAYHYIYQAQQNGVNVVAINNSWGADYEEEEDVQIVKTVIDMVGANGAVSVCASGNEAVDTDQVKNMPSGIDSPYVISVAATNERDELASFSNWGAETVDIAAPGTNILSTVSCPVMHPTFYGDEERAALLHVYENFSNAALTETDNLLEAAENTVDLPYMVKAVGDAEISVTQDTDLFFGLAEEHAASLRFAMTGAKAGDVYTLYLPYTAQSGEHAPFFSMDMRISAPDMVLSDDFFESLEQLDSASHVDIYGAVVDESGVASSHEDYLYSAYLMGNNNYWNSISSEMAERKEGEVCVIGLDVYCNMDGDFEIRLDNLAISDVNAPEEELLLKYDYFNGTSMAAPHVTGAMAALAAANETMSAEERTALLLGCTRKSDALKDKVKSGGVLDLSHISTPNPIITGAELMGDDGTIVVTGNRMPGMVFQINGEAAEILSMEDMTAVLDISGMEKQQIDLEVTLGDMRYTKRFYYAQGTPADALYTSEGGAIVTENGTLLSCGDCLYYCTPAGEIDQAFMDMSEDWVMVSECFPMEEFLSEAEQYIDILSRSTKYVTDGCQIYTVINLDYGYMQKNILAAFDPEACTWSTLAELPGTCCSWTDFAIGYYEGTICLMGGFQSQTGNLSDEMRIFDLDTCTWETGATLPEAACAGEAYMMGDRLILTMQLTEDGTQTAPWIYDGDSWQVSAAPLPETAQLYDNSEQICANASAAVDEWDNQMIYVGLPSIGMGDIFSYLPEEETFEAQEYTVYNNSSDHIFGCTASDGVLYVVYNNGECTETALFALNENAVIGSMDQLTGDVDRDGEVTMDDAYQTLIYDSHMALGDLDYSFTGNMDSAEETAAVLAADVDENGEINMQDAYYILLYTSYLSMGVEVDWYDLIWSE